MEEPTSEDSIAGCLKVTGNNERLVPYNLEVSRALNMLRETREQMGLPTSLDSKLFFGYLNVSRKKQERTFSTDMVLNLLFTKSVQKY